MKNERVFLGLGSNVGRRTAHLRRAVRALQKSPDLRLVRLSRIYETSPVGPRQRNFLNAVAEVRTTLRPAALLSRMKGLEKELGRRPGPRWGPRKIDLDILLFGDRRVKARALMLPHPRWRERKFVLRPLLDLAPLLRDPLTGRTAASFLLKLTDSDQRIKLFRKRPS